MKNDDTRTTPAPTSSNHPHSRQMQDAARETMLPIEVLLNQGVLQTISRIGPETRACQTLLANLLRNVSTPQRQKELAVLEVLLITMVSEMYQQGQGRRPAVSSHRLHRDLRNRISLLDLRQDRRRGISLHGLHASSSRFSISQMIPDCPGIFPGCLASTLNQMS
jgi:hypothetical protein